MTEVYVFMFQSNRQAVRPGGLGRSEGGIDADSWAEGASVRKQDLSRPEEGEITTSAGERWLGTLGSS